MSFLASGKKVRGIMNRIDKQGVEIKLTAQAELDLLAQKISSELESTAREVSSIESAAKQILPILERLKEQAVTYNAPDGMMIALQSIIGEIVSKVDTVKHGCAGIYKNVNDVEGIKKAVDSATDKISRQVDVIDELTNEYQD